MITNAEINFLPVDESHTQYSTGTNLKFINSILNEPFVVLACAFNEVLSAICV